MTYVSTIKNKGSVYILTISSAVVLTGLVLGLAAILMQFRHHSQTDTDIDQAEIYAELGIRHALQFTTTTDDWRDILNSGPWLNDIEVGLASYSVTGIDPVDGNLANNPDDPVYLTCQASIDGVTRTVSVKASSPSHEILNYGIACINNLEIKDRSEIMGHIVSNKDIKKRDTCPVDGNARAGGTIDHTQNITGTTWQHSPGQRFPDVASIMNYYKSRATTIPYQNLIDKIVLSPEFNPYGPANPNGLYYMDARSGSVVIRNCRIKGTLVINSGGQDIIIETSVYWKPAREDYPALVIDGTTGKLFVRTNQDLYESIINRDLSLPGEAGYGTKWTHYPNMIKGLIFSLTDLDFEGYSYIKGSVISMNEITLKDDATLEYDANILNIPPMQFRNFFLAPVRGSWRKVIP